MTSTTDVLLAGGLVAGALYMVGKHKKRAEEYREVAHALAHAHAHAHRRTVPRSPTTPPTSSSAQPPKKPAGPRRVDPHRFDPIFARLGEGIPVAYLRALAIRESNLDPRNVTHHARGLLQIVPSVLADFNKAHDGPAYTPDDLFKPEVSVEVCVWTLRRIIASYARQHPDIPNLQEDWTNPDFVGLLTLGWCAGWSPTRGVGRVVDHIKKNTAVRDTINVDMVADFAKYAVNATRYLRDPRKLRWTKSVVDLYLRFRNEEAVAEAGQSVASAVGGLP